MSAVPKPRKLTAAEYLVIERAADRKSEFVDGVMYAMAGASPAHNDIKENLSGELFTRLRGSGCRTSSSDQRVRAGTAGGYYYPDLVITCGERRYDPDDANTLVNPTVIIEVLSPGTASYDRGGKFEEYQRIASLREYVVVAQDEPRAERWVREAGGAWRPEAPAVGLDAALTLAAVGVSVPLADIYAGVTFPPGPAGA